MEVEMDKPSRVVIVAGGFGCLYAAQALRAAPVEIMLVDRRKYHLFQPLLYEHWSIEPAVDADRWYRTCIHTGTGPQNGSH